MPTLIQNIHSLARSIGQEIKSVKDVEVKHGASVAVGSDAQPVYVAPDGTATAITHTIGKSVPSDAVFTDTVTTASTTGTGNAVTSITASNGALIVTKGSTFLTSHQDISGKANLSGATFTGNVTTSGSFGTPVAVSASAINLSLGTVFTKTLTADVTFTISNAVSAKSNCFSLILTNGGAYTVTWPSTVLWAGGEAPELTENGVDVVTFLTPDGGTTWYGVPSSLDAKASS